MEKTSLAKMSWKEVELARERKPVVLFPLGAVELHGFHVPVGFDYLSSAAVAEKVAEKTGSLALPAIPYGYSESLRNNFPGSFSVREESLAAMIEDVCLNVLDDGFDHVLFVCPHAGNVGAMNRVARKIKRERGIIMARVDPTALAKSFAHELYNIPPSQSGGHGGFISTSVMSYLMPDMIDMEQAKAGQLAEEFQGFKLKSLSEINFQGKAVGLYLDADEVSEGNWGDPSQASPEKGRVLFEKVVEYVSAFVVEFKKFDVRPHQ